eukprot:PhM_4_TR16476/c1_g1_i1/m.11225
MSLYHHPQSRPSHHNPARRPTTVIINSSSTNINNTASNTKTPAKLRDTVSGARNNKYTAMSDAYRRYLVDENISGLGESANRLDAAKKGDGARRRSIFDAYSNSGGGLGDLVDATQSWANKQYSTAKINNDTNSAINTTQQPQQTAPSPTSSPSASGLGAAETLKEWVHSLQQTQARVSGIYTACKLLYMQAVENTRGSTEEKSGAHFKYRTVAASTILCMLVRSELMDGVPLVRDLVADVLSAVFTDFTPDIIDHPNVVSALIDKNIFACNEWTLQGANTVKDRLAAYARHQRQKSLKRDVFAAWRGYARRTVHRKSLQRLFMHTCAEREELRMRWVLDVWSASCPKRGEAHAWRRNNRRMRRLNNRYRRLTLSAKQLSTEPQSRYLSSMNELGVGLARKFMYPKTVRSVEAGIESSSEEESEYGDDVMRIPQAKLLSLCHYVAPHKVPPVDHTVHSTDEFLSLQKNMLTTIFEDTLTSIPTFQPSDKADRTRFVVLCTKYMVEKAIDKLGMRGLFPEASTASSFGGPATLSRPRDEDDDLFAGLDMKASAGPAPAIGAGGVGLSFDERQQRDAICSIPFADVCDIVQDTPELSKGQIFTQIRKLLFIEWRSLNRIFLYYRAISCASVNVSLAEFIQFVKDIAIMDKIPREVWFSAFAIASKKAHTLGDVADVLDGAGGVDSVDVDLIPQQFCHAILRLALHPTVTQACGIDPMLSSAFRLRHFLHNVVIPHAFQSDAGTFIRIVSEPAVQQIVAKYTRPMLTVFNRYASLGGKVKEMTVADFKECLLGLGIMSPTESGGGGGGGAPRNITTYMSRNVANNNTSSALSLDCEMVRTTAGLEVARITFVDFTTREVVYDKLVKPTNPILDYLTAFSGITQSSLKYVRLRREEAVEEILSTVLFSDTILIGHTLRADLEVLQIAHGRVVDVTLLFPNTKRLEPRGAEMVPAGGTVRPPTFSLKMLSATLLCRVIQNDPSRGHDSAEDALACVDLVALKMQHGLSFGLDLEVAGSVGVDGSEFGRHLAEDDVNVQLWGDNKDSSNDANEPFSFDYFRNANPTIQDKLRYVMPPPPPSQQKYFMWAHARSLEQDVRTLAQQCWECNAHPDNHPLVIVVTWSGPLGPSVFFL